MKWKFEPLSRCQIAAQGLVLGFALLIGCPAVAQNLLTNAGFESPLGSNNWTVVYLVGGPPDLHIADRTVYKDHSGSFALHLRPSTDGVVHAYFTQAVSGLLPGTNYVVSGWTAWSGESGQTDKYDAYIEAIGGLGSLSTPSTAAAIDNSYYQYSLIQTADANGKIEVRLHLNRHTTSACCDHIFQLNGYFDDLSLTRQ